MTDTRDDARSDLWSRAMGVVDAIQGFRTDGWFNPFSGFGTTIDASSYTDFQAGAALDLQTLSALYHYDAMAKRIVDIPPREMMRQGVDISGDDGKEILDHAQAIGLLEGIQRGMAWGRAFGGAIMVMGADDGADPKEPLRPEGVDTFEWVKVYDRRDLYISERYTDKALPNYDAPKIYRITHYDGTNSEVHESRCIRFRGAYTAERESRDLQGWDLSVLQACWPALQQFNTSNQAGTNMLSDASTAVFKMAGFIQALSAKDGIQNLTTRAQLMNMTRSMARAVFLDSSQSESFEKVPTQFSGVPDMLDRSANRLAADTEIPVTILMGQAPAGLNATGASDIRIFYDRIASDQRTFLRPILRRCFNLICQVLGKEEDQDFRFRPLWQETPAEREERRQKAAQTDHIYIDDGVVTPLEVRKARFEGEEWSPELKLEEDETPDELTRPWEMPDPMAKDQTPEGEPVDAKEKLPITPTDVAIVVRVDEVRLDLGLPAIGKEAGGNEFLPEFKARFAEVIGVAAAAEAGQTPPGEAPADPTPPPEVPDDATPPPPPAKPDEP